MELTPSVKEMAPEAPASAFVRQNDAEFMAAIGLAPVEAPEPVVPEAEPSVIPTTQPDTPTAKAESEAVEVPLVPAAEATEETADEQPEPVDKVEDKEEDTPPPPTKQYDFKVLDKDGELEVPEISISFKANGKVRENVPLEKVVQLAQMGVYNHEREQEVVQTKQQAQSAIAEAAKLKQAVDQYETYFARVFEDDVFAEEARAAYLRENTPEAKYQRATQELQQVKQNIEQQKADQVVGQFIQQQILPSFEKLMQDNPTVNEHELMGRYSMLTAPYLVRGKFPINSLSKVQQLVDNDLTYWARGIHTERTDAEATKEQQRTEAVKKAQVEAAKAKRQLTRTAGPANGGTKQVPGTKPATKKYAPAASAKDIFNDLFPTQED